WQSLQAGCHAKIAIGSESWRGARSRRPLGKQAVERPTPSKRIPVPVAVNVPPPDMVGRAHEAIGLHPLDPLGGGVVPHPHLPLEPRAARLLVLEHDLARLAVLALLGVVAGGEFVVEAEEA